MPNQDPQNYIEKSRQAGKNDDQIRQVLLGAGWLEKDIDQALKNKGGQQFLIFSRKNWVFPIITTLFLVLYVLQFSTFPAPGRSPLPDYNWFNFIFTIVIFLDFMKDQSFNRLKILVLALNIFLLGLGYNFLYSLRMSAVGATMHDTAETFYSNIIFFYLQQLFVSIPVILLLIYYFYPKPILKKYFLISLPIIVVLAIAMFINYSPSLIQCC